MKMYKALVRVNGVLIEVQVQARSYHDALRMLQGQYGSQNVAMPPTVIG
jgi:hypothetical protein